MFSSLSYCPITKFFVHLSENSGHKSELLNGFLQPCLKRGAWTPFFLEKDFAEMNLHVIEKDSNIHFPEKMRHSVTCEVIF